MGNRQSSTSPSPGLGVGGDGQPPVGRARGWISSLLGFGFVASPRASAENISNATLDYRGDKQTDLLSMTLASTKPTIMDLIDVTNRHDPINRKVYLSVIVQNLYICYMSEVEQFGGRKNVPVGSRGVGCTHCLGGENEHKMFFSIVPDCVRLKFQLYKLNAHFQKCSKCPQNVKGQLETLPKYDDNDNVHNTRVVEELCKIFERLEKEKNSNILKSSEVENGKITNLGIDNPSKRKSLYTPNTPNDENPSFYQSVTKKRKRGRPPTIERFVGSKAKTSPASSLRHILFEGGSAGTTYNLSKSLPESPPSDSAFGAGTADVGEQMRRNVKKGGDEGGESSAGVQADSRCKDQQVLSKADLRPFREGELVYVTKCTEIGIPSRYEGVGKIIAVNTEGRTIDVKYSVGGKQKNIAWTDVSFELFESRERRKSKIDFFKPTEIINQKKRSSLPAQPLKVGSGGLASTPLGMPCSNLGLPLDNPDRRGSMPCSRFRAETKVISESDVSLSSYGDDTYVRYKVLLRLHEEAVQTAKDSLLETEVVQNKYCHLCHYKRPKGFKFPCSKASHIYCEKHIAARLGKTLEDKVSVKHCLICALECDCNTCQKSLNNKVMAAKRQFTNAENARRDLDGHNQADIVMSSKNIQMEDVVATTDTPREASEEALEVFKDEASKECKDALFRGVILPKECKDVNKKVADENDPVKLWSMKNDYTKSEIVLVATRDAHMKTSEEALEAFKDEAPEECKDAEKKVEDESDPVEIWSMKAVYTKSQISGLKPARCEIDGCSLLACATWSSSLGVVWNGCLDCQADELGGWEEGFFPEWNDMKFLLEKCSRRPMLKALGAGWHTCVVCGEGGHVVCCHTCLNMYHLACLPKESAKDSFEKNEEQWHCPKCSTVSGKKKRDRTKCVECSKSSGVMVKCECCRSPMHKMCWPRVLMESSGEILCNKCLTVKKKYQVKVLTESKKVVLPPSPSLVLSRNLEVNLPEHFSADEESSSGQNIMLPLVNFPGRVNANEESSSDLNIMLPVLECHAEYASADEEPSPVPNIKTSALEEEEPSSIQKIKVPVLKCNAKNASAAGKISSVQKIKVPVLECKAEGLPCGWLKQGGVRLNGRIDTFWISPSGMKFRSIKQVVIHMNKQEENAEFDPSKIISFPRFSLELAKSAAYSNSD